VIESATVARPRLGNPSPVVPARVLKLAEQVRSGKMTAAAANRALGTQTKATVSAPRADARKQAALAGARKRLRAYRESRG
jgi:hypothetical protein